MLASNFFFVFLYIKLPATTVYSSTSSVSCFLSFGKVEIAVFSGGFACPPHINHERRGRRLPIEVSSYL